MDTNSDFQVRLTDVIRNVPESDRKAISYICLPNEIIDHACLAQSLISYGVVLTDDDVEELVGSAFGLKGVTKDRLKLNGEPGKFRTWGFSPEQEILFKYLVPWFNQMSGHVKDIKFLCHLFCQDHRLVVLKELILNGRIKDKETTVKFLNFRGMIAAASTVNKSELDKMMGLVMQVETPKPTQPETPKPTQPEPPKSNPQPEPPKSTQPEPPKELQPVETPQPTQPDLPVDVEKDKMIDYVGNFSFDQLNSISVMLDGNGNDGVETIVQKLQNSGVKTLDDCIQFIANCFPKGLPPPLIDIDDPMEIGKFLETYVGSTSNKYLEMARVLGLSSSENAYVFGTYLYMSGYLVDGFWQFVKRFNLLEEVKKRYGNHPNIASLTNADISLRGDKEIGELEDEFINLNNDQIKTITSKSKLLCDPPRYGITLYKILRDRSDTDAQIRAFI